MTKVYDKLAFILPAVLMAVLVFMLMPGSAFAQNAGDGMTAPELYETFIKGEGDTYTMTLLQQIFGSPIFAAAGDETVKRTLFGDIVGYFNAAVLVVAGLMFFNNLATGTVQSAHEGEVLGRQWSSVWAPLRSIMAVGLLIPLPAYNGYNTAQLFTSFLVKNATTFASSVWSVSAEKITTGVIPVTAPIATLPKEVVSEIFLIEMCRTVLNEQLKMGNTDISNVDQIIPVGRDVNSYDMNSGRDVSLFERRYSYDRISNNGNGEVKDTELCGYYKTPAIPDVIGNRFTNPNDSSVDLGTVLNENNASEAVRTNFMQLHERVLATISTQMRAAAETAYAAYKNKSPSVDISGQLEKALVDSRTALDTGYAQIMNQIGTGQNRNNDIRELMIDRIGTQCAEGEACSGEGWIGAGSWYMIIARLNNDISSLFVAAPEASSSKSAGDETSSGPWWRMNNDKENALVKEYNEAYDYGVKNFNNAANRMAAQGWNIDYQAANDIAASINGTEVDEAKTRGVGSAIRNGVMSSIQYLSNPGEQDPMIGIVNFGQTMLQTGVVLVGADFFLPGNVASTVGTAIATAGATMSVVLPMLPFVFWIMAVTGYFLLVVEAFIAVNLWALSMLKMDGEGIFGPHSREGWLMLLAITFTPFLMVAGYFVGMIIFRISAMIISMGLTMSLAGIFSNANWIFICFALLVIAIFMLMIYIVVLERSFSLVSDFPNKVLRWMGAQVNLDTSGTDRVRAAALGSVGTTAHALGNVARDKNFGPAAAGFVGRKLGLNSAKQKPPTITSPNTSGS